MEIKKVTLKEADKIINNREPEGLFYIKIKHYCPAEENLRTTRYIAIDNRTGEAWTEEFSTLRSCKKWLLGEAPDETET